MADLLSSITSDIGSIISIPNASITASTSQPSVKSKTANQATSTESQSTSKIQTKASQSTTLSASTSALISSGLSSLTSQSHLTTTTSALLAISSTSFNDVVTNTSPVQTRSTASSTIASSSSETSSSLTSTDSSTLSTITSASSTTLVTSTSSSSSSSLSTASVTATATPVAANDAADGNQVPTAGIVVAAVMGFLILATMVFLIFRYCPPVRRRYDAWQEKKRLARTYREAIDGVPDYADKTNTDYSPPSGPYTGHRFYTSEDAYHGGRDTRPHDAGLGLGNRLSMLMQHSPFDTGSSGGRPSQIGMAVSNHGYRGSYAPMR